MNEQPTEASLSSPFTIALTSTDTKRSQPQRAYHDTQTRTLGLCIFAFRHSPQVCLPLPPFSQLQMCEDTGSPVIFSQPVTFSSERKWNTTCVSVCMYFNSQNHNPLPHHRPARKSQWWFPKLELRWCRETSVHYKNPPLSIVFAYC